MTSQSTQSEEDKYQSRDLIDYISQTKGLGESQLQKHLSFLEFVQQEEQFPPNKEAFSNHLREAQEIVFVLETTRFLTFPKMGNVASTPKDIDIMEHPHWDLILTKIIREIYPSSISFLDTKVNRVFLPFNLPYQLMIEGQINTRNPGALVEEFTNTDILFKFIGEASITLSDYLLAFQYNIYRLMAQTQSEFEYGSFKSMSKIPPGMTPEICIFYVAENVGVKEAIGYLEALWSGGWLHNTYIFSRIWFALHMWLNSNPKNKCYRLGREKYVKDILFSQKYTRYSGEELLFVARQIMRIARKSITDGRIASKDYSEWIHCVHKHWLHFEAIKLAKYKVEDDVAVPESIRKELTQMWRYCMEITADIESLIGNPFILPLGKMMMTARTTESEKTLDHHLKFLNYGRVAFPEILFKKLSEVIKQETKIGTSFDRLNPILAEMVLENLSISLRQCYTAAFPTNLEEILKLDLPANFDHNQEQKIFDQMSSRSRRISIFLLDLRNAYIFCPHVYDEANFSMVLDQKFVFQFTRKNGNVFQADISDREHNISNAQTFSEEDTKQSELKVVELWIELLNDLLLAMTYLELRSKNDINELSYICLDLHSSPNILFLLFEDGAPKEFNIIPRILLFDEIEYLQDSRNMKLLGIDGSGLFVLVEKANLSFRNNKIGQIPIRCAFRKAENGYVMIELQ